MGSNFQYSIDLNEDHNQNSYEQPFFYPNSSLSHHQISSSSSSSITSLSSYLPFLINSQEVHNNNYHAHHLHDKKETRLKLTIKKKDHHEDKTDLHQNQTKLHSSSDKWMMSPKMRLIKKTITNNNNYKENDLNHKNNFDDEDLKKVSTRRTTGNRYNTVCHGYSNNNIVIRVCSDCSTTKTPLWRSGPRGPKSLCNACGIRQRKARRAAMAAAAAAGDHEVTVASRLQQLPLKKKLQTKKRRSNGGEKYNLSHPVVKEKKCKIKVEKETATDVRDSEMSRKSTAYNSWISSKKVSFDDLSIMLSKSSAYQQDEKEAAILLMALSYGLVQA